MTFDKRSLYDEPTLYDRVVARPPPRWDSISTRRAAVAGDVLELACGTGLLTIPIARALAPEGRRVTALDLAPAMLDAARRKAADVAVDVELVVGDMRGFGLDRRFGTIFVAFNSLLHLTTNDALRDCFAVRARSPRTRGRVAFDIFNPSIKLLARAPEERPTVARVADEELGEIHLETTIDYDAATQVNRGAWHFSALGATGLPDGAAVPAQHLRGDLPVLLVANGFALEARSGDFGRNAFTSESARQVCVCRSVVR